MSPGHVFPLVARNGGVLERGGIGLIFLEAFFLELFLPLPEDLRDFGDVEVMRNA